MNQSSRQELILAKTTEKGFVTIDELVDTFMVTPQTIRRDLNQLANQNKINRHHGGAGVISSTQNTAYKTRKESNSLAKQRIAIAIAQMIPDGSSLFINIGTTTESIATALLDHKHLRVVTNSLHVAAILSAKEDFNVIIAGGEVRFHDGGIVGEATSDFINQFKMDFGIMGISGIHEDGTLLDFDYREVRNARTIINNSHKVFLAADHTKFGRSAMVRLGNVSEADDLFTDQKPAPQILELLEAHQVNLHIL